MYADDPTSTFQERGEALPRDFKDFRGYHAGATMLVCGCGSSLSQIIAPERVLTIGVNDVGRLFDPDYLVVLNPPQQFSGDRFQYVTNSRARAIFSQLDLKIPHPHIVRLRLGRRGGTDFSDPNLLPYTRNSPYPALCLAVHMGARRVGLLGVDFTDDHFFAKTGRHDLDPELAQIDREYYLLSESCKRMGVEVFNLSPQSRLTAFPKMAQEEFAAAAVSPKPGAAKKLFFVNYRFLSCGNVFQDGLANAARQLGLEWQASLWDDPQLPEKVDAFNPDLLFVVHGRRFTGKWGKRFAAQKSAVWLLDEPYEVDDTSRFSPLFDTVYINDPNTLPRHGSSHYLPVCYDPRAHLYLSSEQRPHDVGFVGGFNPFREQALGRLARRGLLSYVIGGPWHDAAVNGLCRSGNIPADETASLYRETRIVVNLFRTNHHYNHAGIPAFSLNPRVYEALGCGALVISEHRPELDTLCPELPVFRTLQEMESLIEQFLQDEKLFRKVRRACIRRLAAHTYGARLATVVARSLGESEANVDTAAISPRREEVMAPVEAIRPHLAPEVAVDWEMHNDCAQADADGNVLLQKTPDDGPGTEQGLVGSLRYGNLSLEFDLFLQGNTTFVAKIHQAEARNQLSNSYHLMCRGSRAYLARHEHVFCDLSVPADRWVSISLSYSDGTLTLRKNGAQLGRVKDFTLPAGYCFVGVKGGTARLRNLRVRTADSWSAERCAAGHQILRAASAQSVPKVSIVTTVFDRVDCLQRCVRSVGELNFRNYEHIIVADAPPSEVLRRIDYLVAHCVPEPARITLATLTTRRNDWGISPAAAGLALARGHYVCFLSDDNGYTPSHFDKLVRTLDDNPGMGFVYSSCLYDARTILNTSTPAHGRIDLGQPLFRRELFQKYLGGMLPFRELSWDWRMIEAFMRHGVRWQHIDDATFIFRLARYPHLIARESMRPSAVASD